METWSYQQNGAVKGPVGEDELRALFEAGRITRRTLVRSTHAGGGWRRYEEVADLRPLGAKPKIPRAVTKLWPWFVFGTPLAGGLLDVYLVRSTGNSFIANNAWLAHAPLALNLLAMLVWFLLIWNEVRRKVTRNSAAEMVVFLVAAPVYQAFTWWGTALVATFVNISFGLGVAACPADIVKAQVLAEVERTAERAGTAAMHAVAITDPQEKWLVDRMRLCTGKLETADAQPHLVRYRIEDRGFNLFRYTLHGLSVRTLVE